MPEIVDKLYKYLENLIIYFDKYEIEYWITAGTLLGAVRNNAIIEWDDDIDLVIKYSEININKLESIKKDLINLKSDMAICNCSFGYKFYCINNPKIKINPWKEHIASLNLININRAEKLKIASKSYTNDIKNKKFTDYTFPNIDIMLYSENNNRFECINNWFPKEFYMNDNIYPLKNYKLKNLTVKGVNNPYPYLYNTYGNDCLTVCRSPEYDHLNNKRLIPKII
jgi:phosphorylcholine metabolism protein LicD